MRLTRCATFSLPLAQLPGPNDQTKRVLQIVLCSLLYGIDYKIISYSSISPHLIDFSSPGISRNDGRYVLHVILRISRKFELEELFFKLGRQIAKKKKSIPLLYPWLDNGTFFKGLFI